MKNIPDIITSTRVWPSSVMTETIGVMKWGFVFSTQLALLWNLLFIMLISTRCQHTIGEQSYFPEATGFDKEYSTMDEEDSPVRQYIDKLNEQYDQVYIKPGESVDLVFSHTLKYEQNCNDIVLFMWSRVYPEVTVRTLYEIIHNHIQTHAGYLPHFEKRNFMIAIENFCITIVVEIPFHTVSQHFTNNTCSSHIVLFSTAYVHICNTTDKFIDQIFMNWSHQINWPVLAITYSNRLRFTLPDDQHGQFFLADFYQCTYTPVLCKSSRTYPHRIFVIISKESVQVDRMILGLGFDVLVPHCKCVLPPSHNNSRTDHIFMEYSITWSRDTVMLPANSTKYAIETTPAEKIGTTEFSIVTSYLTILAGDENDFGNYTCTIKCYISANGSMLDEINLCPQQRTTYIQPEDYVNQALHYKSRANMYKNLFEDVNNSFNTVVNVSKNFQASCTSQIEEHQLTIFLFKILVVETIMFIVLICSSVYCTYRMDKVISAYKEHAKNVLRDLSQAVTQKVPENLKYDIFLSYSTLDSDWVDTSLLPFLKTRNYKVWIIDRDFNPGVSRVECTWKAINESEKTIAVLSPDFLNSRWCVDYELTLTLTRLLDENGPTDSLVILEYRKCNIPKILTGRIYLDFTDTSAEKGNFDKLLAMLGQPIPRESE